MSLARHAPIRFDEPGFALRKEPGFGSNPNRRRLPSDDPTNARDSDSNPLTWNGVGDGLAAAL